LDIKGFFMSLNKQILFDVIERQIKNPELLWLANLIIFHDPVTDFTRKGDPLLFGRIPPHKSLFHVPKSQGLPIGNLTSQFFANVYLNEFDRFVKHDLKVEYYLRYVDDFLLLSNDKAQLLDWRNRIDAFLKERLQLELNHKKQILQTTDKGIDWLGYIVKPNCVLIRRRIVRSCKRKLHEFNDTLPKAESGQLALPFPEYDPPMELLQKILAVINSYYGHFSHADTYTLRKHLWENHFQKLRDFLEPKNGHFTCFSLKRKVSDRKYGRTSGKRAT